MLWKAVINKKNCIHWIAVYVPVKQKVLKHIIAIKINLIKITSTYTTYDITAICHVDTVNPEIKHVESSKRLCRIAKRIWSYSPNIDSGIITLDQKAKLSYYINF